MSRRLQDRLALASYKSKNGLDNMSFSLVEAHIDDRLRRRGGALSVVSSSSSSSSASDIHLYTRDLQSSPLGAPHFSDGLYCEDDGLGSRKRARFQEQYLDPSPSSSSRKTRKGYRSSRSFSTTNRGWKTRHNLPASSPLKGHFEPDFRTSHGPNLSFVSTASTVPESPLLPCSDSSTPTLPAIYHGSPPRTPPPTQSRGLRNRKSNHVLNEKEGADLLVYLATSPSPAHPKSKGSPRFLPSTPPQNNAVLPSSLLDTPNGGFSMFNGFSTPGPTFNFGDFVNATPSPAQAAFNRTPGPAKTPLAAKEARRRLNFGLGSPVFTRSKDKGLGMEIGGELVT